MNDDLKNQMLEALEDMWAMLDEGLLVRDISHDAEPDYIMRNAKFVLRLKKVSNVIAKARGKL